MVRRGPWKLTHYHGYGVPQLFNLDDDPQELVDRARDPVCATVRARLREEALAGWSGNAIEAELRRRAEGADLLRAWGRMMPVDPTDFWQAPAGANVFPGE